MTGNIIEADGGFTMPMVARATQEQKAFNKNLSKERIVVEHMISKVKKFNVFGTEFRNRLRNYDVMTDIVSGLVNFRIMDSKSLIFT